MPDSQRDEIAKLEALFAANPEGRIFTHLAEAYRKAGELDRARDVLETGIARHPDYASAHVVLGRVQRDRGAAAAARDAFRRVLELDAHNLVALRALGDLAREAGAADEALSRYQTLLAFEPANEELREIVSSLEAARAPEPEAAPEEPEAQSAWEQPAAEEDLRIDFGGDMPAPEAEAEPEEGAGLLDYTGSGAGDESSGMQELSFGGSDSIPGLPTAHDLSGVLSEGGAASDSTFDLSGLSFGDDRPGNRVPETEVDASGLQPDSLDAGTADERSLDMGPTIDMSSMDFGDFSGDRRQPEPQSVDAAPSSEDDGDWEPAIEAEVETETIADLYMQQGLHERAAGVYRKLLEHRPADDVLRSKLARAEQAPGGSAEPEQVEDSAAEDFSIQVDEPFAADDIVTEDVGLVTGESIHEEAVREFSPDESVSGSVENYYDDVFGSEETPLVGREEIGELEAEAEADEVEAGADGGGQELLAHGAQTDENAGSETASAWLSQHSPAVSEPTPYAWREDSQEADELADNASIGSYFAHLLSWRPTATVAPGAAAVPRRDEPEEAAEPVDESPAGADPIGDAWISPGETASAVPDEIDALFASADTEGADELDALFSSAPADTAGEELASAPSPEAESASDSPDDAAAPDDAVSRGEETPGPSGAPEDEEDLEMFRTWLQSLKH